MQTRIIVLVGPTAVGKTALAVRLAEKADGEIIGADSRQIYRYMDIGTAKPTAEERARVPHHLIDIVTPDDVLTLGQYRALAYAQIEQIAAHGKRPFLVGGAGLYLKTVVEGWTIPQVEPNPVLRAELQALAESQGCDALFQKLQSVDPLAAARVDARNVRRVIRYLEVYYATGEPISARRHKQPPPYSVLQIGLTLPRPALYRRIDDRVDQMLACGLVEEVRALLGRGYNPNLPALSGFGYKQVIQYLRGECSLEQAVAETKKETRRFVRRQYAWYRLDDPHIVWLRADADPYTPACRIVETFLSS